jgi:hypothetical protein
MTACIKPCGCPLGNCLCHANREEPSPIFPIYTVTTLTTNYNPTLNDTVILRSRCVGYYPYLSDATQCILENWGDIYENGHYTHAVIEEVKPGIYAFPRREWWYKWEKEERGYMPIDKPEGLKYSVCFGIG